MRKLLLCAPFTGFHQYGGAESVISSYIAYARAWGFQVQVATTSPRRADSRKSTSPEGFAFFPHWPGYYSDGTTTPETARLFRDFIERTRPDVVHVLSIGLLGFINSLWPVKLPFRLVFSYFETPYIWPTSHDTMKNVPDPWQRYALIARQILESSHMDAFIPFSELYRSWGHGVLGIPLDKWRLTVRPSCEPPETRLDLNPEQEPHSKKYILIVGRLVPRKGTAKLLSELNSIAAGTRANIVITDPRPEDDFHSPYRASVLSMLSKMPNVKLADPRISSPDLSSLYQRALCVAYPSIHEGYGLVPVEAAAHGCPTIGFDIEGTLDTLVHGGNGWRVPAYDWKRFVSNLCSIWDAKQEFSKDKHALRAWHAAHRDRAAEDWGALRQLLTV